VPRQLDPPLAHRLSIFFFFLSRLQKITWPFSSVACTQGHTSKASLRAAMEQMPDLAVAHTTPRERHRPGAPPHPSIVGAVTGGLRRWPFGNEIHILRRPPKSSRFFRLSPDWSSVWSRSFLSPRRDREISTLNCCPEETFGDSNCAWSMVREVGTAVFGPGSDANAPALTFAVIARHLVHIKSAQILGDFGYRRRARPAGNAAACQCHIR